MAKIEKAPQELSAKEFIKQLDLLASRKVNGTDDLGMGQVFALAKEFMNMPLKEVEKLLNSSVHKVRVGAVSIMDFQARSKKTTPQRRKELFNLYIRRHDRIDTWDLVD